LEKRLSDFDEELGELIRNIPLWRERYELLRSMPGVDKVLSSTPLAQWLSKTAVNQRAFHRSDQTSEKYLSLLVAGWIELFLDRRKS
jgi:hypothetical protein